MKSYFRSISKTFSIMLLTSNNIIFGVFSVYVIFGGHITATICFAIIISFLVG